MVSPLVPNQPRKESAAAAQIVSPTIDSDHCLPSLNKEFGVSRDDLIEETVIEQTVDYPRRSKSTLQAITAPAVVSGAGNALIVAATAPLSCAVMVILAGITARNELVSREVSIDRNSDDTHPMTTPAGLKSFIARKAVSPGLCADLQGWTYVVTAGWAAAVGNPVAALSFGLYSLGSWAGASIANSGKDIPKFEPIRLEQEASKLWQHIPKRLQFVLRDPAATFAIGNIPIFSQTIFQSISATGTTSLNPFLAIGLAIGSCCALSAAAVGLRPLVTSTEPQTSGLASRINGIGNTVLSVCMIWGAVSVGNIPGLYAGCAALCWGFSNFGFARRIDALNRQNI